MHGKPRIKLPLTEEAPLATTKFDGMWPVALTYRFQPVASTPIQAFKALQCWLYQCTEGEIPELSKLYTFFDKVVAPEWAQLLIMRTPEYEQAEWG